MRFYTFYNIIEPNEAGKMSGKKGAGVGMI
jgi:hypothetical protein